MTGSENTVIKTEPSAAVFLEMRVCRLSKIFLNMTVAAFVLTLLALLSSVLAPVAYAVALIAVLAFVLISILVTVIFTFGVILLVSDGPVQKLWEFMTGFAESGDSVMTVTAMLFNSAKWISLAGMVLSLISAIFICLSKSSRYKAVKLIFLALLTVMLGIVFVFYLITGGIQLT